MTKRCNETCMTDGRCTCAPRRVVTEGLDASGEPFVAVDGAPVHVRHELVEDGAGRLSLSIIPADWDPSAHVKHCAEYLAERSGAMASSMARWPGGIGDEPAFGEPV